MPEVEYPSLFMAADSASRSGQKWYAWLAQLNLGFVLLGALLAGIGSTGAPSWRQGTAIAAAISIGVAVIVRWVNRAERRDKTWFDGRAVAESVKTASWRYMMRVEPFDASDQEADAKLVAELDEILKARTELILGATEASDGQITAAMREARALPFSPRKSFYLENRLRNQANWYLARARLHRRRAITWFVVGLIAELLAITWAVIRVANPDALNLIGFFTSIAAGATAFGQLQRNDDLSRSYSLASQELQLIQSLVDGANVESRFLELIKSSEGAISREHTMWIAKRS